MTIRRLMRPVLCLLLAVLMLSGSSPFAPWLWTCRHSARLVAAPFTARPGEMPCGMPAGAMSHGNMACCRRHALSASRSAAPGMSLGAPDCHPRFVKLASLPNGTPAKGSAASLPMPAAAVIVAQNAWNGSPDLTKELHKQRPPPDLLLPRDLASSNGLRAPPAA